jgi:iron complex outermembrane receptor protein
LYAAITLVLAGGLASVARAAETAPVLEEVVVTAERREANLQAVPIAVTALSSEALARSVITSTVDLQTLTPGLVFTTNGPYGQPYVRGVGTDIINSGSDGSIAVHVDGVYQARAAAAIQDFLDVARVEVLKGPQGTLYGRNATGGAINVYTNEPTYDWSGDLTLRAGNFAKREGSLVVNAPLVDDRAALRIAVLGDSRDGYTHNLLTGQKLDDEGLWEYRAKLRLDPTERLSVLLSAQAVRENSTRNDGPKVDSSLPSPAVDVFGAVIPPGPRNVRYNTPMMLRKKLTDESLRIRYDFGPVVLTSITAHAVSDWRTQLDIDATEVDFTWDRVHERSSATSEELQLASQAGGKLEWIAGAYFLHEDAVQSLNIFFTPLAADVNYPDVRNVTRASALFGQGTWKLADRARLTAGLRYSRERRQGTFHEVITDPFGALTGIPGGATLDFGSVSERTWTAWTPKLAFEYDVAKDVMAYASVTRGFKSGGFNLVGAGEMFQPETIWSYELGLKSTLLDHRLRLNLAAFWYDYKDLQVNRFNPATGGATSTVTNAAQAKIKGFEAEVEAAVAPGLDADASLALLDAKYGTFLTSNPDAADPFATQDLDGNVLPRAPRVTAAAGLQYTWTMSEKLALTLRGEARYQGHIFFDQFNSAHVEQGSYTLGNVYATLKSPDERWHVQLFCRNVSDELYKQSVVRATSLIGTLDFWGPPRTYGVDVGYRFGR